jgi:cell fate regulator YaaT (PSP1 superfamily)
MSHLIEVAFKGNRKEFFLWDGDDPPRPRAAIIVEGDRGEDLGRVHAIGENAEQRFAGVAHGAVLYGGGPGAQPAKRALRMATPEDVTRVEELTEQNELARRKSLERVKAHGLVMKVSDAEWQWDRRKLTLYFTAEKRVDFRSLVRDLAALFRTRIELKQIGVRDEAKRLDGVGRCGREYCSSSWLPELRPVNLSVAKDQHLSLNPTQISGACGRLMCSLRYEHEFYVQARKRFPKEGRVLVTARGEEKVLANDIFRDRVSLRGADGETRSVPLADLRRELAGDTAESRAPSEEMTIEQEPSARDLEEALDAIPASDRRRADRRRAPDAHDDAPSHALNRRAGPRAGTRAELPVVAIVEEIQAVVELAPAPPVPEPLERDDAPVDGDNDVGEESTDDSADATDIADGAEGTDGSAPRPRRRRGRRGGRRGRGGASGPPSDVSASDSPASDSPASDPPASDSPPPND